MVPRLIPSAYYTCSPHIPPLSLSNEVASLRVYSYAFTNLADVARVLRQLDEAGGGVLWSRVRLGALHVHPLLRLHGGADPPHLSTGTAPPRAPHPWPIQRRRIYGQGAALGGRC